MAKIPRRLYTALALLCFVFSALAQEPTDKEIGFDREDTKKHLLEEKKFNSTKELDDELNSVRTYMVNSYRKASAYRSANAWVDIPDSGCTNMGFDNNTEGWAMYWSNGVYDQNAQLSSNPNATTTYSLLGSGSITGVTGVNMQRISVVPGNSTDLVLGVVKSASSANPVIRIGEPQQRYTGREEIIKKFNLTPENSVLKYGYAVVLNDAGHDASSNPYFQINISIVDDNGPVTTLPAECSKIQYNAIQASYLGFETSNITPNNNSGAFRYKTWQPTMINLADYVNFSNHPIVTISFNVSDCIANGNNHEAWAYVEAECVSAQNVLGISGDKCVGSQLNIFNQGIEVFTGDTVQWQIFASGSTTPMYTTPNTQLSYQFQTPGTYHITYTIDHQVGCDMTFEQDVVIENCAAGPCKYCASFNPSKGERYIISGWVKEQGKDGQDIQVKTYEEPVIKLEYTDVSQSIIGTEIFHAAGAVIDGWQRIYGEFTIPANIDDLRIKLMSGKKYYAYFDDIRVFPFNGSMKSYVYDQATQRLMAELDENNYATFYEYDTEGGLVRIKKETVEGVRTIQETRSANPKKP